MQFIRCSALVLAILAGLSAPLAAADSTLVLDPETTAITFDLEATGHDVHGTFHLRDGSVRFDEATGEADGTIRIDATAAESGNGKRDKTMHADVLHSEEHPAILFRIDGVEAGDRAADGRRELVFTGDVRLLGDEHPVRLPVHLREHDGRFDADADLVVPYVDWGLHDPSILFLRVAKEVTVHIAAQGTLGGGTVDAVTAGAGVDR